MHAFPLIAGLILTASCGPAGSQQPEFHAGPVGVGRPVFNTEGATIDTRVAPPRGYERVPVPASSFAAYLRALPLKPDGTPVLLYNGRPKGNQGAHAAVVDLDAGTQDLQQCADAVMRLRAEYLFSTGQKNAIHFNFTNGFRAEFSRWTRGERISLKGSPHWIGGATPDASHAALRKYLDVVYAYAGTLSLSGELKSVPYPELRAGDVLIRGGSPGHAVMVVDMAQNKAGEQVFLLAQSYMPAQDVHLLINPQDGGRSPWYSLHPAAATVETPEWTFGTTELKRFAD